MTTHIYQGVITYQRISGQFSEYYTPKEKKDFFAAVFAGQKDGQQMTAWQWLEKPFKHEVPAPRDDGETGGLETALINTSGQQERR